MPRPCRRGLFLAPNSYESRSPDEQKAILLDYADWIKAGLAGNLASYQFITARGELTTADRIFYGGVPVGYTHDPQENIVYVSAHDNETIFDAIQLKAPEAATLADRVRINNLALDLTMLSQGVPFFHAGDDLLRSKSLDRNSYNSGDWFNKLDFTMQDNNFGVGLPAEGEGNYGYMRPLLAGPALKPAPADIQFAASHFQTMLAVRHSSRLFRLQTAEQVQRSLTFLNTGPDQVPGLIVMQLTDIDALDPDLDGLLVLFNASPEPAAFADPSLIGLPLEPYAPYTTDNTDPAIANAAFDSATGAFTLPARSTIIYALAESGQYQAQPATATIQPATVTPTVTLAPTSTVMPTLAATATLVATPVTGIAGQSFSTLNIIAVAVAILGALGAFALIRSRNSDPEPEPPPEPTNKKLSRTQRRKNRK